MTSTIITEHQIHGKTVEALKLNTHGNKYDLIIQHDNTDAFVELTQNEAQRLSNALKPFIEEN